MLVRGDRGSPVGNQSDTDSSNRKIPRPNPLQVIRRTQIDIAPRLHGESSSNATSSSSRVYSDFAGFEVANLKIIHSGQHL